MQQTFPMDLEPRVNLTQVNGDVEITGWEKREISLDLQDEDSNFYQEGNTFTLVHYSGDLTLRVPYDTEIRIEELRGTTSAQDIRRIDFKNVHGDITLQNIGAGINTEAGGEAIALTDIAGDLKVQKASSLRARRKLAGDVKLEDVPLVEIEAVGADLDMDRVEMAAIGNVGGDLTVVNLSEALRCANVGSDCEISGSTHAEINLGNIGGDLEIAGATLVQLGNAGGDIKLRDIQQTVQAGNVGSDAQIVGVGGNLAIGRVGSDAMLRGVNGAVRIGGIGGNLELQASFPPECKTHLHIGGDASITLPTPANLALQAIIGGSLSSSSFSFNEHSKLVRIVYGEGAAQLSLSVGGDLRLNGGGTPQVSSANMPWWEFGQEMAGLAQEMGRMGQELGQEFENIFNSTGWSERAWGDEISRKVEEQVQKARKKAEQHVRKAEQRAEHAEQRARHAQERARLRADRVRMRINDREWQMSEERINDLVNRVQQAASEGIAGAMEAVERAIGNLRTPPSRPHWPPVPPIPTSGPVPPVPPPPPAYPFPPMNAPVPENTSQPDQPARAAQAPGVEGTVDEVPDLEQEREAILRMIAEGRISPEEGDMLLEGLGG